MTSKMHLLQTFLFWTLNFDDFLFLSQLTQERVVYLKRKLCIDTNECSFKIGRISFMRACVIKKVRPILYGAPCTLNSFIISLKMLSNDQISDTKLINYELSLMKFSPGTNDIAVAQERLSTLCGRQNFVRTNQHIRIEFINYPLCF